MSSQDIREIFQALDDVSPLRRSKAIEELRMSVKENNGHLLFGNIKRLFSVLKARLRDNNWNVAHQSIQFLSDLFRNQDLGPDCNGYLSVILPTLVENLGDSKIVIRKASQQVLKDLLLHNDSSGLVMDTIVGTGFENDDWRVRQESVHSVAVLIDDTVVNYVDFQNLCEALVSRLRDASMVVVQAAQDTLFALRSLTAEDRVQASIEKMGSSQKQLFEAHTESIMKPDMPLEITPASDTLLQYGFIPFNVAKQLRDTVNWKVRAAGIEELQRVVRSLVAVGPAVPQLPNFMEFCVTLLADQNFKIALTTVQILGMLVEKFGAHMEGSLHIVVPPLIDKLGDNKIVVRQAIMKVFKALIQFVNPDPILVLLLARIADKNARVREEVINTVIVVLMTNSEHAYQFQKIVAALGTVLYDSKPKVRDAAQDALAVISELIGSEAACKLLSFANIDDEVFFELQERFSRHELPKISAEGIVLHVAHGGGRGLTIDAADSDADGASSRRQTPAMGTPSKIPWELPNSRSGGSRMSSGMGSRRVSSDQPNAHRDGEERVQTGPEGFSNPSQSNRRTVSAAALDGNGAFSRIRSEDEPTAAFSDWRWPPDGVSSPGIKEDDRPTKSRGVYTASKPYFDDADYQPLPPLPPPSDGGGAWWEAGDQQPYGDLADPISPARGGYYGPGMNYQEHYLPGSDRSRSSPSPLGLNRFHYGPTPHGDPKSPQSPPSHQRAGSGGTSYPSGSARSVPTVLQEETPRREGAKPARQGTTQDRSHIWLPSSGGGGGVTEGGEKVGMSHKDDTAISATPRTVSNPYSDYDDRPLPNSNYKSRPAGGSDQPPVGSGGGATPPTNAGIADPMDRPLDNNNFLQSPQYSQYVASATGDSDERVQGSSFKAGRRGMSGGKPASAASSVGSAPVSAPSSAASSMLADENGNAKLKLLRTPQRNGQPAQGRRARPSPHESPSGPTKDRSGQPGSGRPGKVASGVSDRSPDRTGGGLGGKSAIEIGARPMEMVSFEDLKPVPHPPAKVFKACTRDLSSAASWDEQFRACDTIRALCKYNPEVLSGQVAAVTKDVLALATNLRSSVARNALLTLHDMFQGLRRQMDPVLPIAVPVLVKRACETNNFICEEADQALAKMVACSGDAAALAALIQQAGMKNGLVRSKAAKNLAKLTEVAGNHWGLCSGKELDRLLPLFGSFLSDGNPDTRRCGRRGMFLVAQLVDRTRGEFERRASLALRSDDLRKALDAVAQGRTNGGHALDDDMQSGQGGRWNAGKGGQVSRLTQSSTSSVGKGSVKKGQERGTPRRRTAGASGAAEDEYEEDAGSGGLMVQASAPEGRQHGGGMRKPVRVPTSYRTIKDIPELEVLPQLYSALGSSDWRARHKALQDLADIVLQFPTEIAAKLVALFDHWTLRMADGNAKVLLLALTALATMIPVLKNALVVVLSTLIPPMCQQLGSASQAIRAAAVNAFDMLCTHVDNDSLVPHLADQVAYGNPRSVAMIVHKLAAITKVVHAHRPELVAKHLVPRAVRLVDDMSSETRQAVTELLMVLHDCIGDRLLQANMADEQRRKVAAAISGDSNYHRIGRQN